jgi:hypothetical protein
VGEVERLVGQDPGLLDAKNIGNVTPLMAASDEGHMEVVRWLVDKGGLRRGGHAWDVSFVSCKQKGRRPVVRLLVARGADPTIAMIAGYTPLMVASLQGHLEVVRCLLGHPSARTMINHRDLDGKTALWVACDKGRSGVVKALLESGADPTIPRHDGTTPIGIAKAHHSTHVSNDGYGHCVAALEVRFYTPLNTCFSRKLAHTLGGISSYVLAGGGAGLSTVEGPAGGRPAGEQRGGGGGWTGGERGRREGGAGGLRGSQAEGGPVPGPDGVYGVRAREGDVIIRAFELGLFLLSS